MYQVNAITVITHGFLEPANDAVFEDCIFQTQEERTRLNDGVQIQITVNGNIQATGFEACIVGKEGGNRYGSHKDKDSREPDVF